MILPSRIPRWIFPEGHQEVVLPANLTGRRERIDPVVIAPEGRQRNHPLANVSAERHVAVPEGRQFARRLPGD